MFTEDSSFIPRPGHAVVSWLIHGRLAFLSQVPPGPRPLCTRNGARTWAGRPSEPQLGSGKTSGDEPAYCTQSIFLLSQHPTPLLLINFITIGARQCSNHNWVRFSAFTIRAHVV